jgi:hypothetical protein
MATETTGSAVSTTVAADAKAVDKAISAWKLNGWAAVAIAVAANVIGVLFHI